MANVKIEIDKYYCIVSASGKVLEVEGGSSETGAAVQLWDAAAADHQQWKFLPAGDGVYKIENKATGKCWTL